MICIPSSVYYINHVECLNTTHYYTLLQRLHPCRTKYGVCPEIWKWKLFSFPQATSQRHTMVPTYELDRPDQPFNATEWIMCGRKYKDVPLAEFKWQQKDNNEGNEWKTCISGSIQDISSIGSTIDSRNYTLQAVEGRRDDFLTFSYHFYGFLRPYCEFGQNWRSSRGLIRNSVKNAARGEFLVRSKNPKNPNSVYDISSHYRGSLQHLWIVPCRRPRVCWCILNQNVLFSKSCPYIYDMCLIFFLDQAGSCRILSPGLSPALAPH